MKKLLIILAILALLATADARIPIKGDYVRVLSNGNGFYSSNEGIVIDPNAISEERCLAINVTRMCGTVRCFDYNTSDITLIPWRIIYNITWPENNSIYAY